MIQPATASSLTPREKLRWQRAMDALLIGSIYGRAIRDVPVPPRERVATITAEPSIVIA